MVGSSGRSDLGRDCRPWIAAKAAPAVRALRCGLRLTAVRLTASALCLSVIVSGCTTVPTSTVPTRSLTTAQTPATQFALSGRFSAKAANEQVSGQFRYTENGGKRTLNLFSPLGTPLAEIIAMRDGATLTQANGSTQTAASLAALLRTVIDLPVSDAMMSAWLQGVPSGSEAETEKGAERDGAGLLTRFTEGGWIIEISERMERGASAASAPRRMRWSLAGVPDTEVRWVMDVWGTP